MTAWHADSPNHTPALSAAGSDSLTPSDEHGRLAWKALREDRWADVERHASRMSIENAIAQAWKQYFVGRTAMQRRRLADAEGALLQGAAMALLAPFEPIPAPMADVARLAAQCLEFAGRVIRRRDRATEAIQVHAHALRLRAQWGAVENQWETRISLGLDCITACDLPGASEHFTLAVDLAKACTFEPVERLATAWSHLATVLTAMKLHAEAVTAARQALTARLEHDMESEEVPRAKLHLGKALLALAEFLTVTEPESAASLLDEASELLDAARRELPAFSSGLSLEAGEATALLKALRELRGGQA